MISRARIFTVIGLAIALSGCGPKPDASVVLWEQPAPQIAAEAHAREKGLVARVVEGRSMEPLIVAGDWAVFDVAAKFEDIAPGQLCIYAPEWEPNKLAIHMAAARSGDGWKMDGIGNRNYDPGVILLPQYWGKVVQVYTRRAKP